MHPKEHTISLICMLRQSDDCDATFPSRSIEVGENSRPKTHLGLTFPHPMTANAHPRPKHKRCRGRDGDAESFHSGRARSCAVNLFAICVGQIVIRRAHNTAFVRDNKPVLFSVN